MTSRTLLTMVATGGIAAAAVVAGSVHDGARAEPPTEAAAPAPAGTTKQVTSRTHATNGHVENVVEQVTSGSYVAITPYRAYDSRFDRRLVRGDAGTIDMLTDMNLTPQIPPTATAITFNVTVTETASTFGFVTVFPGDSTFIPNTSTINWTLAGFTVANGGTVALGGPGPYQGRVGVYVDGASDASTQLLIDVTGYYLP